MSTNCPNLNLDYIVVMDETTMSYHTPEMKKQSKQWILKGQPGPLKGHARGHAVRTKQMVMVFFNSQGLIYIHICWVPQSTPPTPSRSWSCSWNTSSKRGSDMARKQWWFQWDNKPVPTPASVKDWMAAKGIQLLEHLLHSICWIWHWLAFPCLGV
jgi:hypothetical protein